MMLVLQKEIFKPAVECKGDGRNAQAGKGAFEAVPSSERSGISPFLPRRQ